MQIFTPSPSWISLLAWIAWIAWNGSGVGGSTDLRLRKGLLQLKNQKDFSHQAGVFRNFPLHNIFIYSGCVKSSQEDSRWSKMTWDYKGSVYRKDDSVRVPSKKLAGTFNIWCQIFVMAFVFVFVFLCVFVFVIVIPGGLWIVCAVRSKKSSIEDLVLMRTKLP